jgi:large subunit ribosomal protein L1
VLVLCTPEKEDEAKEAGADYVGLDDYIEKIEKGWTDMDVIITMPP